MHQYRHGKLPPSFTGIFNETTISEGVQSRHNDYNYRNKPAVRTTLEKFPLKQIIFNWNSLDIELKATGDLDEFQSMVSRKLLSQYRYDTECPIDCFSCSQKYLSSVPPFCNFIIIKKKNLGLAFLIGIIIFTKILFPARHGICFVHLVVYYLYVYIISYSFVFLVQISFVLIICTFSLTIIFNLIYFLAKGKKDFLQST